MEYKVIRCFDTDAESNMNEAASQGWKVFSIIPSGATGKYVLITFCKGK